MKKKFLCMVCLLAFGVAPSSAQWYQLAVSPSGRSFYSGGIFFSPGGLWLAPVFTYPTCYSSLDTGKTWTTHTFPRVGLGAIRSIRFFDKFNGVIEFTANSTAEITSDGGQTWIETYGESLDGAFLGSANRILEAWGSVVVVSQPPFSSGSVIFLAGGGGSFSFIITPKGTAFAGHDPIQMSTDFGATWQPRLGRYDLDSYSMDVGKYCDDSTIYIANEWDRDKGNYGEIYVSTDAGNSFVTKLPHSLYGYITGSMVTSNHAAFCATSTDGVLRSTDKGQAWKSIGGPGSGIDVRSIAVINDSTLFVLDTLGILWETTNSGGYPFKAPLPPKPQIVSTPANVSSCDSTNTTVSIMHTYCDPLTITEATLQGTDASNFTLQPPVLPVSLGNGAKVIFNLGFNPKKEVRTFSAQIHVKGFYIFEYQDTVRIDTLIEVSGTSTPVAPIFTAAPIYLDFDTLTTCLPPQDTTVTLTNKGCDTLQIITGPGALIPEFTLVTPLSLPIKLAPDSSIKITFRFKPSGTGNFSTTATFTALQQTLTQDISINLTGDGVRDVGVLSYAPKKFSFPSISICSHDSASGFVANIGCDSLQLDPASIFGDPDYQVSGVGGQTLELKQGDTVKYNVYLNPAQKGIRQGYLVLNSNDGIKSRRDTVPFTVTVTDGTRILATSINAIDFGSTTLCNEKDTSIALRNTGCDTLELSGIGGLASGFGTNTIFPITILPGHDTTIDIFTMLDTSGGKTFNLASLTFTSNSDTTISPITLTRSYIPSRNINLGLFLDPTPKSGGDQSTVSYDIKESPGTSFTGAGIKQITFDLNYNTNLLDFQTSLSSGNLSFLGGTSFVINGSPEIDTNANGVLASIGFRVYLTKDSTTTIEMTNRADTTNLPCSIMTLSQNGSATFDYNFLCGERSISGFMNGVIPLSITSIRPNPAQDEIEIDLQSAMKQDANIEIRNTLGAKVFSDTKNLISGSNTIHLDTKNLTSGMYLVRVGSASQSLVISR